jgi:hypothetical protein
MFRKSARIDVVIEESKDVQESKHGQSVFTVNVKIVSGRLLHYLESRTG